VRLTVMIGLVLFGTKPTQTRPQLPSGVIEGLIYDQTKTLIPDTNVRVTNSETEFVRSALTDPPGSYDVEVQNPHFTSPAQKNILLGLGRL
jgi:hypothetical protein